MKLIEHIIRNDRPVTEIITADYIMVSPYSARGYGVYDELKSKFKNPDNPFEYVPVKLKALVASPSTASTRRADSPTCSQSASRAKSFQLLSGGGRCHGSASERSRIRVRPEHNHEALREYAGIAEHTASKKLPLGVTDKERRRGLWG